jgi:hypothetical protein
MMNREPATPEQVSELAESLNRMDCECQLMLDLTTTMYGSGDERSSRAAELCNNLQRLRWALDRGDASNVAALFRHTSGNSRNRPLHSDDSGFPISFSRKLD